MGSSPVQPHEISKNLRAARQRMNIHRNKKMAEIDKRIDAIVENMKSGQENLALIQAETVINNERQIECYDVLSVMTEQVLERVRMMTRFPEPLADMDKTFATIIYASYRSEVEELAIAKNHIVSKYGEKYVKMLEQDVGLVNETIREKIDLQMPKLGDKALRIEKILIERGLPVNFTMNTANELRKKKEGLRIDNPSIPPIPNPNTTPFYPGGQNPPTFQPQFNPPLPNYGSNSSFKQPLNPPPNFQPNPPPNFQPNPPPNFQPNPPLNTNAIPPQNFNPQFNMPSNMNQMNNPPVNNFVPQPPANFQPIPPSLPNYGNQNPNPMPPSNQNGFTASIPNFGQPPLNNNPTFPDNQKMDKPKNSLDEIPMVKNSTYLADNNNNNLGDLEERLKNLKNL